MYPSVSHSHEKQYLREIPSKFEELHFLLYLKPVILWIFYLFILMHFRKYLSRLLTPELSLPEQTLYL